MSKTKQIDVINLDYLGLAVGVRLHYCQVRQQHWLLFPEGAISLNANAIAILTLCNGNRSFNELVTALKRQFRDVKESDIEKLLSQMIQRGLLVKRLTTND
ncbi:pyrroloquinoline quinone biosynthesis peptide chaperone PqqD [Pleurocapsales cyanobacterium LEGE 10410]|nr:pyrroloquinoline quinone biosynthesis peptide chaperone PqqD [Pleurocapsales cyanobacterium LEGE 10410]